MRKHIPILIICLAILCLFSSCAQLEKLVLEGTWTIDFKRGTEYCNYKLVFSGEEVQVIKRVYRLSGHRMLKSTDVMEPMPYTVGKDGIVTVDCSLGVMNKIDFKYIINIDESQRRLIWKEGYFKWEYSLNKESDDTGFITPSRGYEQYSCELVQYQEPGEEMSIEDSNLFIYSDGKYSWEGDGRTVSSGRWETSETEPNKISLIASDRWTFSRMNLEYIIDSPEASHLKTLSIEDDNLDFFSGFSYDLSWYADFYR